MEFFKRFKNSIFSINSYKELVNVRFSSSLLYIALISIIFSIFISIKAGISINKGFNYLINFYNNDFPEFTYDSGILKVDIEMPYIIEEEESGDIFYIDTREEADKSIIDTYDNGIFIFQDEFITKKDNGHTFSDYNYSELTSDLGNVYFTKENLKEIFPAIKKFKSYLYVIIFIIYFIYQSISLLFLSILYTFLSFIISKIMKGNLIFDKLWTICVYSLTLPTLLGVLALGFSLPIPYFKTIKFIITVVYIVLVIKVLKSKNNEDNDNLLSYSEA